MIKTLKLFFIFCFFMFAISFEIFARFDVSSEASYSKQVYGTDGTNALRTRSYGGSMAYYFYYLTAVEINYIHDKTTNTENLSYKVTGTDYTLKSAQSELVSEVISVGIRQAFSGPEARFRPTISLGYAYRLSQDFSSYHYENDLNSNDIYIRERGPLKKQNSFFSAFGVQFRMIGQFYIKGSVQTVFPFFRPNLASDYLRYTVGFLWSF